MKVKPSDFNRSMKINLYSPLYIILEIIKKSLKLKSKLNIINISSNTIKFFGSKKNTTYLVSKNALEISLLNLSKSFVKKNIKINIIRPGLIKTNMTNNIKNYTKKFSKKKKTCANRKTWRSKDISNMVSFLASDKCKFTFGQIFTVSGGE